MGLFSWLRGIFTSSPRPFMTRPGLNGRDVSLHWPKGTTQIDIYLETDAPTADEAIRYWNAQMGRRFFAPALPAIPDMLRAFGDPKLRAGLKGSVLVRVDDSDSNHGTTHIEYDKRTGGIISAVVTLPGRARNRAGVATHEFGHVLGLDHGPDGTLMGARLPDGVVPLAGYQARAVIGIGR